MALRAVPDHPKFARLKMLLKLPKGSTLGWLESVWHFTGRFTPHGNIGKYTDQEIEAWVEWDGEPGSLISSLVTSQWIDRSDAHRLVVHDWHVHADNATKLSVKRSGKPFVDAGVSTVSPQCVDKVDESATPCGLPVPEPVPEPVITPSPSETRPPATQPDLIEPGVGEREKSFREGIDRLFAYYCRKLGRDPTRYTLTADRRKKARMRLEEREKLGGFDLALSEAKQCIDNLASSDYHRTNGYVDWNEQIFRSAEEFEKRLMWQEPRGGANGHTTATGRSMAAAAEYLETLRDHEMFDGTGDQEAGGSVQGNIRRLC